ncbi:DUF5391 family protein [Evansella halocellulosilytica]|uniref:DUF5391 family protein n=1 Tax=Evansella halocellulosilytica TaxID=2011013 RepID=UPI000BB9907E|nr:DUF5391 family protein [Evansella halocellulosilytica]
MKNKFDFTLITTVSALLFCSFIIVASLSPLSETGPNANEFGSFGMWSAVIFVLVCYAFPLLLFPIGVKSMKVVMALLCSLGLLINVSVISVMLASGFYTERFIPLLLGICMAAIVINVIWFYVAFRSSSKLQQQSEIA